MSTIQAIVRNGRIEVEGPLNLPDGTPLTIQIPENAIVDQAGSNLNGDTPEAIEQWIRWYDSLEPLEFTRQERQDWEVARQEQRRRPKAGL